MAFSEGDSLLFKNVFAFSFAYNLLFLDNLVFSSAARLKKSSRGATFLKTTIGKTGGEQ